jgi:putative DNA primase/helicase
MARLNKVTSTQPCPKPDVTSWRLIPGTASRKPNPKLDAALQVLSLGFVPIPIKENEKHPPLVPWKKYQKEKPSVGEVKAWWQQWPDANIAIVTGEASGVDVIDIDIGHEPWPLEGCSLPTGCVVSTPRGGQHCYIKHVEGVGNSTSRLAKGVDVRGDGGYVLIPPSTVSGRSYHFQSGSLATARQTISPAWLHEELTRKESQRKATADSSRISEGMRNDALTRLAGAMRRKGMSKEAMLAALLEENRQRCDPPLPEVEVERIVESIGKKEPTIDAPAETELSDSWNARHFVEEHGDHLRYCPALRAWFFWNGMFWERDNRLRVEKMAQEFVRKQYSMIADIPDSTERKKVLNHIRNSESKRGIESMIHLARSLGKVTVGAEELDRNDELLNTRSGVLELTPADPRLEPRAHSQDDLITKMCPVEYDPSAESELWDRFLESATQGDKELLLFLQRCAGYCLLGKNPEEKFFFVYGPTASGKSTFIEAIKATLGDYAIAINASVFLQQRNSGGAQPEVVKIKGARIVIASETEPNKKFNADLIKGMSGRDTIGCRDLYSKPIEFSFGGKLWLVSNFAPAVAVDDEAFMRRIIVIPFKHERPEEERNPNFKTVLTDPKQSGAAILRWMIEGYCNYLDIGLAIPEVVLEANRGYKEEINPVTDFFADSCTIDRGNPEYVETTVDLYRAYTEWANKSGSRPVSKKYFGGCLKEMGLENDRCSINGKRARTWIGIKLNPERNTPSG